jgi:hypothetical protein
MAIPKRTLRRFRLLMAGGALVSLAAAGACSMGAIGSGSTASSSGGVSSLGGNTAGAGGGGSSGVGGISSPGGGAVATGSDPGSVPMHRLNAFEYDNTINDLFGMSQQVAEKTFIADETGTNGFDNEADALTMSDAEFQQYFTAADTLGEQVFASAALTAAVIPAGTTQDANGLLSVMTNFGLRAYRRPVTSDEVTRFQSLAADAVTQGSDFNGQVKQIVKMMLASVPFLYRVELDANPSSTTPHAVAPYELASRLSYLLWSSMPDATLFADAASGALVTDATLGAELLRMLGDARASNFVSSFAGQWLGARTLNSHQVEPSAFPEWNTTLQQSLVQEELLYFNEFLNGDLPWTQFLTAPVNFVNGANASLYSINSPPAAAATKGIAPTQTTLTKVMGMDPNRVGFLGLGGFLTQTSYSYRTVPTLRGKWVLLNLLGEVVPSPPAGVPPLDSSATASTDTATQEENVRARLLAHRMMGASCAACHNRLDPIGLGMENFDGVGAYRTSYGDGEAIDSSGELPDGTTFTTVTQLAGILSAGSRLTELVDYTAQQLMTYAISRPLNLDPTTGTDVAYLTQIQSAWTPQGYLFNKLMTDVVMNDTFRLRHGGL